MIPKFRYLWSHKILLAVAVTSVSLLPSEIPYCSELFYMTVFLKSRIRGQGHRGYRVSSLISRPHGTTYGSNATGNCYHHFLSSEPIRTETVLLRSYWKSRKVKRPFPLTLEGCNSLKGIALRNLKLFSKFLHCFRT